MRLSTEILAVTGDAREERGLGRRQLWFATGTELDADADAYADTSYADSDAHAEDDAYADAYAVLDAHTHADAHAETETP